MDRLSIEDSRKYKNIKKKLFKKKYVFKITLNTSRNFWPPVKDKHSPRTVQFLFPVAWQYSGRFGLYFGLKLAFVVTWFPQKVRVQRDYKLVPSCVHDCQSPINSSTKVHSC